MSLTDPRVIKQADILVNYSVNVKKKDRVLIVSDWMARPLALAVYKACILAGAIETRVNFEVDEQILSHSYNEFSEIFLKYAKPFQLNAYPLISDTELKNIDCWIRIYALNNTRGYSNINPRIIGRRAKVIRPLINRRILKTRWVISSFPTESQAQEADMSLSEYEDFVYKAVNNVNWKKKFQEQKKLASLLTKTDKVHILGPETDLRLGKRGRTAINCAGLFNMPDGEVFTSIVENEADGFITYTYPALYLGKEFHKVYLEFQDGKVVRANADKNEKDLNKILNTDSGARRVGELGIGNNFEIKKFTKGILFDEKIGGSIHIALGSGYNETGSKNISAIHWDMIKDLRKAEPSRNALNKAELGGELWFDDKLVQKNGKWQIKLS